MGPVSPSFPKRPPGTWPVTSEPSPWTITCIAWNGKLTPSWTAVSGVVTRAMKTPIWQPPSLQAGVTMTVNGEPSAWVPVIVTACPAAATSCCWMFSGAVIALPLTVWMWSPGRIPALAAIEPLTTPITFPGSLLSWLRPKPVISTTATTKFATGPASRIAIRCSAGLEWKPLGSSKSPASMPPMRT